MSIKPALTAQEWAALDCIEACIGDDGLTLGNHIHPAANPHGIAALCLHGQPFGFSREDVRSLRTLANDHPRIAFVLCGALADLADRIEAMLPPLEVA